MTDFSEIDTLIHADGGANTGSWQSQNEVSTGILTFSFANIAIIESLALWNDRSTRAIRQFELFADDDDNFTNDRGNLLGTFTANREERSFITAQTFSFESTRTQYVHLRILNNHGGNFLEAREVAFERTLVPFEISPIPGITFILGAGYINYFQRKGKKGQRSHGGTSRRRN